MQNLVTLDWTKLKTTCNATWTLTQMTLAFTWTGMTWYPLQAQRLMFQGSVQQNELFISLTVGRIWIISVWFVDTTVWITLSRGSSVELWFLNCLGILSIKESGGMWRRCIYENAHNAAVCDGFVCCHVSCDVAWTSAGVCSALQLSSRQTGVHFSFCLFFGCFCVCVNARDMWVYRKSSVSTSFHPVPTVVPSWGFRSQYLKHER